MSSIEITQPRPLRRANDVFVSGGVRPPQPLFDEFWREGEVALLFGAHGAGKSILAVEIAEALARGRRIKGLEMPETRQNVLYVDLVLSDTQFGFRYSCEGQRAMRRYKFSANLYRDRPPEDKDLIEWLNSVVAAAKIRVVIIDDLSMISRSDGGTRQTLELVRELRRMTRKLGISVLVLADSNPYVFNRETSERDLRRARILCAYSDSVFALEAVKGTVWHHLVQTRSQAADLAWTSRSPAHFRLAERDDGFVGFDFVEVSLTPEQRKLICEIKVMHDVGGRSFREIAEALGISKSTAARLYRKWRPSLVPKIEPPASVEPPDAVTEDEEDIDGEERDRYGFDVDEYRVKTDVADEVPFVFDPRLIPYAAALGRRSIHDLERDLDHNDEVIFVESREERSGRPQVWYKRRPRGKDYVRYIRDGWGISGDTIGPSPYLPRAIEIAYTQPGRPPP